MKKLDREALQRCVKEFCRDPKHAEQLKRHAKNGDSWEERAHFACAYMQSRNMRLDPWEFAPCSSGMVIYGHQPDLELRRRKAQHLADRLRAAGLSIYEPDPVNALHEIALKNHRSLRLVEPPSAA